MSDPFDDLLKANPAPTREAPAAKPSDPFEALIAAHPEPSMLGKIGNAVGDVVQSAGAGIIRGAAGMVDLPQTLYGIADGVTGWAADKTAEGIIRAFGGTPAFDRGVKVPKIGSLIPSPSDLPMPGESAIHGLEAVTQPLYAPQTTAGEYARTVAEFVPGAGKNVLAAVKNAVIPAVASETAGQVTKGTAAEPWARLAGGIGAGVGQALHKQASTAERLFDRSFGDVSPEEFAKIKSLFDEAAGLRAADGTATPIDLTWAEAAQKVLGPRRAGDMLRIIEGQGGLSAFFAKRPDQIRSAGRAALDEVAPSGATPTQVGDSVRAAATNAVAATPEGQGVIRATQAVGPRVSADQAGQVIQREMREVADAREAVRSEQAARDYAAARSAPETVGVDRTVTVERPGEPIVTPQEWSRPQFEPGAPRPLDPPPTAEQRGVPSFPITAERQGVRQTAGRVTDEYQAALSEAQSRLGTDLRNAGIDSESVHPDVMERTLGAMMRGEHLDPLDAFERVVGAMKENPSPRVTPTTVTEEISAPRFGQVDPQPALVALDNQIRSAKGDVRSSLESIRRDLYEHGVDPVSGVRETDLTVEGLLHTRERIDRHIAEASDAHDRTKLRDLQAVRSSLDDRLKGVPEVAAADANFAANSRPVEPFTGNTPLARVTARDDLSGRMQTPAEQVPGQLQGATATREFLANATQQARRAFQGREVTRILDSASAAEGGTTANSIRTAMRENEDVLRQLPEARSNLGRLAAAHEAREAIERSPLGRIARSKSVREAIDVLFPTKPVEGSAAEVGRAVSGVAQSNPLAARQLVRSYLGTEFSEATQALQSGPNQAGGAKFAARIRGNEAQWDSLSAALGALPGGEGIRAGFGRLLDIMEATGTRQGVGSRTSFNNEALAEVKKGGAVVEGGKAAATGGFALPGRIRVAIEDWQAGKNIDRLAELMTSAEGGRRLEQLATAKPGAATIAILNRLTMIGARALNSGDRPPRTDGQPLKLTVKPSP